MMELITLGILAGVILALLAYHAYFVRETNKEKFKLINSLIAKNATELRDLELTEKVKPINPPVIKEPDLVPEAELTQDEFEKAVKEEIA